MDEQAARSALYLEWAPPPALASTVACTWAARFADTGAPHVDRVLPDGCIDLLWMNRRLVVAGPDTAAALLPPNPGARIVGIRFRPGIAPLVLDAPASALLNARIDASDVLDDRAAAAALSDSLAQAPTAREAAQALAAHIARWLDAGRAVDALVQAAVVSLRAARPSPTVGRVAADLGVSERQLHRRFVAAVGYGPKVLARVLRLQRFVSDAAGLGPGVRSLSQLAWAAGYADQPHLTRECRELAGVTPAALAGYPSITT